MDLFIPLVDDDVLVVPEVFQVDELVSQQGGDQVVPLPLPGCAASWPRPVSDVGSPPSLPLSPDSDG